MSKKFGDINIVPIFAMSNNDNEIKRARQSAPRYTLRHTHTIVH
jgi:hypothetical protein